MVAGGLGGCALSIKQSGFDAFAAGAVVVAVATWRGAWNRHDRRLALPALFAGLALPLGALALHGAFTGWHRWWYAVAAYRLEQRSVFLNMDWGRLGTTFRVVAPVLVPALVIVVVLVAGMSGRRVLPGRATAVLLVWATFAALAFGLGGQFHLHYWTILMFPVGTLAGTLVASVTSRAVRFVTAAVLLIGPTVQTVESWTIDRREIGTRLHHDGRLNADEHLADWFRVRAGPDDRLYALCASAGLYGNISADPPYPYLWLDGVDRIPGAHTLLARLLEGPDAPRFVAVFQSASRCDPSGRVGAALGTRYRVATVIDGIRVFERVGAASSILDGDR